MLRKLAPYTLLVAVTLIFAELFHPLAAIQSLAQGDCQTFKETGKTVCGRFLSYWQQHGALAQQGFPISAEFTEISDLNGQPYTVQYFERAVFEKHPENAAPNDVLLSQLGTFQFKRKYPNGEPSGGAQPTPPPAQATPTNPPPAVGAKVELIAYTTYKPKYSGRQAAGYVKNTGSADATGVQIIATFKDGSGKIVGTGSADCYCLLRAGDFFPFSVGQSSSDPDFTSVAFQVVFQAATARDKSFYYNDFQVNDINVVPPAGYNGLKVLGTVKNVGSGTSTRTKIEALITDASGKAIDVEYTYSRLDPIPPGGSVSFELEMPNATEAPIVKVAVYGSSK